MSFNLDVPALDNNPVLIAELRPSKIAEFIERIPFNNIFSAATILLEEMQILNRQKVSADNRTKALELYRPAVIRITYELRDLYINNTSYPMPAKVKSCASAAELLWLELAYGYKLAYLDYKSKLINARSKPAALVLQRAIHSLYKLSLVYYSIYFSPPSSIWADLHQLYYSAVQQGADTIEVQDTESTTNNVSSVELAYKQAVLTGLTNPQHLAKTDIQRVADYLSHLSESALLRGIGTTESDSGVFLIKLNSNQLPIPFTKKPTKPNAANDILLITLDVARKMHQHLKLLQEGKIPADGYFSSDALDLNYTDLLTYLIKQLGATPKRLFSRACKDHKVQLVFGITDIFQSLESSTKSLAKVSTWQVLNTSAIGFALRKFQTGEVSIKVGDFVAMKETSESGWVIAVLRWIIADQQDSLDIGLQLLAPSVSTIGIKSSKSTHYENALTLPEVAPLKLPETIVVARGIYSPATVFDIIQNGALTQVLATKLIERTANFERFQFSTL
ncbi:MAG: hypothetical protein H7Z18_07820 [Methylophilaceae bacterium]|nr:hypothetical protein [Methylophilaceae bacterium]